jgi:hypothetical protein
VIISGWRALKYSILAVTFLHVDKGKNRLQPPVIFVFPGGPAGGEQLATFDNILPKSLIKFRVANFDKILASDQNH